ncbi:HNH endonuclease [Paraburkholderia sp. SIMBA_030]|uniref:HNH endonuclease n=1 Tax=Paraburkholderia sp. SIMBA_030 TaxID=3085773 RepID=UPI00397E74E2
MGFLTKKFAHYEQIAELVRSTFRGNVSEFDSGNGFRLRLSGKQTIAFYWRENHGDNWAELALDPPALSPDMGLSPSSHVVGNWIERQVALTARQCAIHKHDGEQSKPWPIVGFGSQTELDAFLESYRRLRAAPLAYGPTHAAVPIQADPLSLAASRLLQAYRFRVACGEADTTREAIARQRIGQDLLREVVLDAWGNRCALTGIEHPSLLIASHIKPWRDSLDAERLDPYNALPLAAHIDAAFDVKLISFEDDGSIIISCQLSEADLETLGISTASRLTQPLRPGYLPYLAWHRDSLRG